MAGYRYLLSENNNVREYCLRCVKETVVVEERRGNDVVKMCVKCGRVHGETAVPDEARMGQTVTVRER